MPQQISFEIGYGVVSFHWSGQGAVKIHTQFASQREAVEAFEQLRFEVESVLLTLATDLEPREERHDTDRPLAPPGSGLSGLLSDVMRDPRLVAQQRPTSGSGPTDYSKLPPTAALSSAKKLAEDQVAAYARAQGRASEPSSSDEAILLPQAKPVPMKAEVKQPTHEEALAQAREFINQQRRAMGLPPTEPETQTAPVSDVSGAEYVRARIDRQVQSEMVTSLTPGQILPPPPPPDSVPEIDEAVSKSS